MMKQIILISACLSLVACGDGSSSGGGSPTNPPANNIRGINYDPAHSAAYLSGQQQNDANGLNEMRQSIDSDLEQISSLGFNVVKTYYSQYCNGVGCINIADEVAKVPNLKLAIGVFEFSQQNGGEPRSYTLDQMTAVITAVNKYPNEIVAIIVGNEDVTDTDSLGNSIGNDIINDINAIKTSISGSNVPIGTSQTQNTWMNPGVLPNGFLNALTLVGANIYPFFGGTSNGIAAANSITASVAQITSTLKSSGYNGKIVVTEEGFASSGTAANTYPSLQNENNYYLTWKNRSDSFDSYYFSMYDLVPGSEFSIDNPNNYFGLCNENGKTKLISMMNCGCRSACKIDPLKVKIRAQN